jgi:dimethylsulfone monooxygenase
MSIQFAYWVPNINGGLVFSNILKRSNWNFDCNTQLAQTAETVGFDYALLQAQFIDDYGADCQLEALTTAVGIAKYTKRLKAIASIHPGLWHPGTVAKMAATIDFVLDGRFCLNVVSGGFSNEFFEQRYRRSEEFIRIMKGMWTEDKFKFEGDFYSLNSNLNKPQLQRQPHLEIFLGGNSKSARRLAANVSDWYFLNGNTVERVREQIVEVSRLARHYGRKVKFGLNAFPIARDTEAEAHVALEEIISEADEQSVKRFSKANKSTGITAKTSKSSRDRKKRQKRWASFNFSDLVEYGDGFKTGLIGTQQQIAEKIVQYQEAGVELILCSFLNPSSELRAFGQNVITLVREMENRCYLAKLVVA